MKTILLWAVARKPRRVVHEQLEMSLPGSRLSREQLAGLALLRRLREQLAERRD